MGRKTSIIPKASVARILVKAGAKRVSANGAAALADALTDIAMRISTKASEIAKHTGRKTVHEGDIKLASK
ncbi:NFYB/HAP3 family transcription factor subunit [Candidatus Woesearchaeota archaeon]|nr:NFYB/HAP3 family transcription factor subunit [Candidatus Woesearchaeota archaeon]